MKLLALETSHTPGMLALLEDDTIAWDRSLPPGTRTTQSFAMAMQEALRECGWRASEVELFAVSRGPGSFTGLRIGITAAKVFGYATGCPVITVDTLDILAAQAFADPACSGISNPTGDTHGGPNLWVALDAQRQQLFVRRYRHEEGQETPCGETAIVDAEPWLTGGTEGLIVSGSGLQRWTDLLPAHQCTDRRTWIPRAVTLARLARRSHERGARESFWSIAPEYIRRSAAEEKADG